MIIHVLSNFANTESIKTSDSLYSLIQQQNHQIPRIRGKFSFRLLIRYLIEILVRLKGGLLCHFITTVRLVDVTRMGMVAHIVDYAASM